MPSNLPKFCRPKRRKLHLTAGERNRIQNKRQRKIAKLNDPNYVKCDSDSSEENSWIVPSYLTPPNNKKDGDDQPDPDTDELLKEICTPKTKKIREQINQNLIYIVRSARLEGIHYVDIKEKYKEITCDDLVFDLVKARLVTDRLSIDFADRDRIPRLCDIIVDLNRSCSVWKEDPEIENDEHFIFYLKQLREDERSMNNLADGIDRMKVRRR